METLAMGPYSLTAEPSVDELSADDTEFTLTPTQELEEGGLDYSEETPYEDQVNKAGGLKDRIGRTKVYLLEDEAVWGRKRKRERDDDGDDTLGEPPSMIPAVDTELSSPSDRRPNAILLSGPPIGTVSTSLLFGYAAQWNVKPVGLEWVNDMTCVYVFEREEEAQNALDALAASTGMQDDNWRTAHPLPPSLLPLEERVSRTLGVAGEVGTIRMRWATVGDVKKRGAGWESQFYKKKRRRAPGDEGEEDHKERRGGRGRHVDKDAQEEELDRELEAIRRGEPTERSLIQRAGDRSTGRRRGGRSERRGRGRDTRRGPERKTQQELDDELDAFLREGET